MVKFKEQRLWNKKQLRLDSGSVSYCLLSSAPSYKGIHSTTASLKAVLSMKTVHIKSGCHIKGSLVQIIVALLRVVT